MSVTSRCYPITAHLHHGLLGVRLTGRKEASSSNKCCAQAASPRCRRRRRPGLPRAPASPGRVWRAGQQPGERRAAPLEKLGTGQPMGFGRPRLRGCLPFFPCPE